MDWSIQNPEGVVSQDVYLVAVLGLVEGASQGMMDILWLSTLYASATSLRY